MPDQPISRAGAEETERDRKWLAEESEHCAYADEITHDDLKSHYVAAMLNWTEAIRQRDAAEARGRRAGLEEARELCRTIEAASVKLEQKDSPNHEWQVGATKGVGRCIEAIDQAMAARSGE